jgi:putative ABC transport system substrate-binding protein
VRRRDFIKVIAASTVVWPLASLAQQSAMPVIGFLSFRSANESARVEAAFREGLAEIGYSEGRNVHIAFRWAEGQTERLPALAADLECAPCGSAIGSHQLAYFSPRSPSAVIGCSVERHENSPAENWFNYTPGNKAGRPAGPISLVAR